MSFVSVFPTNTVKFSYAPPPKAITVADSGAGLEWFLVYKAATLTPEDLERAPDELSRAVNDLLNLLASLKRVSQGDYVLAEHINKLVDALYLLDRYNQLVAYWLYIHRFYISQDLYDKVYDTSFSFRRLFKVKAGDLIETEPWNTITDLLALEYELLLTFINNIPRTKSVYDRGRGMETTSLEITS